jgi:hypothetical protein
MEMLLLPLTHDGQMAITREKIISATKRGLAIVVTINIRGILDCNRFVQLAAVAAADL